MPRPCELSIFHQFSSWNIPFIIHLSCNFHTFCHSAFDQQLVRCYFIRIHFQKIF